MTDLRHGVSFDIGDLGKQSVSWTAKGSTNAWLALDRNHNGIIDDATELFGNLTAQPAPPPGEYKNGFLALAVFDDPKYGGNGDGVINSKDAVYSSLLLWQDKNHDGISQPEELKHLSDFGISAIDLRYEESQRTDEYGNTFRYRSKVYRADGTHDGRWTYDVILITGGFDDYAASQPAYLRAFGH